MQTLRTTLPDKACNSPDKQKSVSRRAIRPFLVLSALAFGPSGIRYALATSSMAIGLGVICAAIFVAGLVGILPWPRRGMAGYVIAISALVTIVLVHLFITTLWFNPDYSRAGLSLLLICVSMLGAVVCRSSLFSDGDALERALYWTSICFLLVAFAGLAGLSPHSSLASERPLFPFTEPSHFALTVMPFLAFVCVRLRGRSRDAILIGAAIFAYLIKSLSLFVGLIIIGAVLLPVGYAVLLTGVALAALQYVDLTYFSERVDLSQGSTNLSAMIYRQGWELVEKSFNVTHGVGVGFQQLGVAPVSTVTSDLIYLYSHEYTNLQDGGFTAAKLMSEFGLFGIVISGAYMTIFALSCINLRKMIIHGRSDSHKIFAYCCVIGYSIEFLIRGLGYFSGTTILLFSSLIYLSKNRDSSYASNERMAEENFEVPVPQGAALD